jgi:hypothetical protein
MFVTHSRFECPVPLQFGEGSQQWRALELSTDLPWFLGVARTGIGRGAHDRVWMLADPRFLLPAAGEAGHGSFTELRLVAPGYVLGEAGGWRARNIRRVWRSHENEQPLLAFEDSTGNVVDELGFQIAAFDKGKHSKVLELPRRSWAETKLRLVGHR